MTRKVRLIDVTMRDAHQCLWATRMTTAMMKDIAPRLDEAGFEAIDLVGGAVFDVMVRYLREDPWERMRILNQWVTKTPLIIHTRGQSLFTFEFFADDVVELAAERFAANGMRYHTPMTRSTTCATWRSRSRPPSATASTWWADLHIRTVRFTPTTTM
jgi:oxaloacetate decarboxylase alpha subunit